MEKFLEKSKQAQGDNHKEIAINATCNARSKSKEQKEKAKEKQRQETNIMETKINDIYRNHLASRVKSSNLRD